MKKSLYIMMALLTMVLQGQAQKFLDIYKDGSIVSSVATADIDSMVIGNDVNARTVDFYHGESVFHHTVAGNIDSVKVFRAEDEPLVYMGIVGFNQELYEKPIAVLQESTASDFNGFISGLTRKDGTLLYWPFGNRPQGSGETYTVNGVEFTMVAVEGGTFQMGSESGFSDEKPVHQVTLSTFSIGETEVTQELWEAVMGSNPSYYKGSKLPVEQVSLNDCQTFITKLNQLTGQTFRLPTEAEWEYAARGGNQSMGYTYAGSNTLGEVAWCYGNSSYETHDVATKSPNELGIYDMSGNVWEWCQDWYGSYSSSAQTNPTGASSNSMRVLRGGSWSNGARSCRVSLRNYCTPTFTDYSLGLRLAL